MSLVPAGPGGTARLPLFCKITRVERRPAEVPEDLDKATYALLCELMPERMRIGVR